MSQNTIEKVHAYIKLIAVYDTTDPLKWAKTTSQLLDGQIADDFKILARTLLESKIPKVVLQRVGASGLDSHTALIDAIRKDLVTIPNLMSVVVQMQQLINNPPADRNFIEWASTVYAFYWHFRGGEELKDKDVLLLTVQLVRNLPEDMRNHFMLNTNNLTVWTSFLSTLTALTTNTSNSMTSNSSSSNSSIPSANVSYADRNRADRYRGDRGRVDRNTTCQRCGRIGHHITKCFATKDKDGTILTSPKGMDVPAKFKKRSARLAEESEMNTSHTQPQPQPTVNLAFGYNDEEDDNDDASTDLSRLDDSELEEELKRRRINPKS